MDGEDGGVSLSGAAASGTGVGIRTPLAYDRMGASGGGGVGSALFLGTPQDRGRREDMPLDMLNPGAVRI